MLTINLLLPPPTKSEINAWRQKVRKPDDFDVSTFMAIPIPFVDLFFASSKKDDPYELHRERLSSVPGAVDRDWSRSPVIQSYVAQVRAQGRDLILIELQSFVRQTEIEAAAAAAAAAKPDTRSVLGSAMAASVGAIAVCATALAGKAFSGLGSVDETVAQRALSPTAALGLDLGGAVLASSISGPAGDLAVEAATEVVAEVASTAVSEGASLLFGLF